MSKDILSMREAFGEALCETATIYNNLYVISADTENSMGLKVMKRRFPNRVYNVGICEQNMALIAAGMATCNSKVIIATYATFASMRILEQIRTYIACMNLDIKIVAGMGGLSGGMEGISHQAIEDISIMRSIPNMTVVVPADVCSTKEITKRIIEYNGPVYLRLGRNRVEHIFNRYNFQIGKANILKANGKDATIVCMGTVLDRVYKLNSILCENNIEVIIVEMPCIKPIDKEIIIEMAKKTRRMITIEENNIIGGLGSAVAEILCENIPIPLLRIGINDVFTKGGPCNELLDYYGFLPSQMFEKIARFIKKHYNT